MTLYHSQIQLHMIIGAQWPSVTVVECLARDQRGVGLILIGDCFMSLSKIFSIDSTQEDLSQHNWKIVDWGIKNQIK